MSAFFGIFHCILLGGICIAMIVMAVIYKVKGPDAFKKKDDSQKENLL